MQFQSLEKFKSDYPSWSDLIEKFDEHLFEVSNRAEGFSSLTSSQLAKHLGIDRHKALALLGLADDAGIVHPEYVVYSPEHWELGRYSSESAIPEKIYSKEEDRTYTSDEVLVELLFELEDERDSAYA